MKFISFKNILFVSICLLELVSHLNAKKNEPKKAEETFSKKLLKKIGPHLLKSNRTNTNCISDIKMWYSALKNPKSPWPFQSKEI